MQTQFRLIFGSIRALFSNSIAYNVFWLPFKSLGYFFIIIENEWFYL